jgi:hypothetical protein
VFDHLFVASVEFGSCLLDQHHPDCPVGRLSEQRLAIVVNWHVVINDYFLDFSFEPQQQSVDPLLGILLLSEDALDPLLVLDQTGSGCLETLFDWIV